MATLVQAAQLLHGEAAVALTKAQTLYAKLVWIVVLLIAVGYGANLAGYQGLNLYLSVAFTVGLIVWWFQPKNLAFVVGTGAAIGALPKGPSISHATKRLSIAYVRLLGALLLWGSVLFFTLGTISFAGHHSAFVGLTAGGLLLVHMKREWRMGNGRFTRTAFYLYVCVVMVTFALSLVPDKEALFVKVTGVAPPTIGVTDVDRERTDIFKTQDTVSQQADLIELKKIHAKVKAGVELTPEEQDFLFNRKKEEAPQKVSAPSPQPKSVVPVIPPVVVPQGTPQAVVSQCTKESPCSSTENEDGSSKSTEVPGGKTLCFELGTWNRIEELGLMISLGGMAQETAFPCSAEQIFGGKCLVQYDHFRFKPPSKTRLPNYWFVPRNAGQC